jgi:hypothetical protein
MRGKLVRALDDVVIGDHMPGGIPNDPRTRLNVALLLPGLRRFRGFVRAKTDTTEGETVWKSLIVVRSVSVRSVRGAIVRGELAEYHQVTI